MKISLKKHYFILKISVTTACNLQHAELSYFAAACSFTLTGIFLIQLSAIKVCIPKCPTFPLGRENEWWSAREFLSNFYSQHTDMVQRVTVKRCTEAFIQSPANQAPVID